MNGRAFSVQSLSTLTITSEPLNTDHLADTDMKGHKASINNVSHVEHRYKPQSAGILSYLPKFAVPYTELMHLLKPGGYCMFFFPHMFGAFYVSMIVSPSPSPRCLLYVASMLACGLVFLQGAACTWNDYVDCNYDQQVAHCCNQPLARGAVSTIAAVIFMVTQMAMEAGAFLLPLPPECQAPAAVLTASQVIYLLQALHPLPASRTWLFACVGPLCRSGSDGARCVCLG